ncbi:MAG: hypothetical protein ACM3XS_09545 [Bacteroidota bacterium]
MRRGAALLCGFLLLAGARPALAADRPQLVILAVDRLTLGDLFAPGLPNLRRLAEEGAVGLMTTRIPGGLSPGRIYLSVGAGEPQAAGPEIGLALEAEESYMGLTGAEAYRLQTGADPGADRIFHLGLAGAAAANDAAYLPDHLGRLGEALRRSGCRAAVVGNADASGSPGREAVAMVMDRRGRVPLGRVGEATLTADWRAPGGRRTNYAMLRREYDRLRGRADLILFVLGDLERIHAAGAALTAAQAERQVRAALRRVDEFTGWLLRAGRRPSRIMLFVACPPLSRMATGERLTPLILWGRGVKPGLAYSGSTRQAGVVLPFDATATIAAQFGLAAGLSTGRPISSRPGKAAALPGYYAYLIRNYRQRSPLLQAYGYALLIAALCALVLEIRGHTRPAEMARCLLCGLAAVPVALLLLGAAPLGPTWLTILLTLVSAILWGLVCHRALPAGAARPAAVGLAATLVVLADVLFGSPLLRRSLLGYSPVFGARFYGLGNEYLGVALGGIILGGASLTALPVRRAGSFLPAFFALATLIVAAPRLGANIGGGIAAVAGLGYTAYILLGRRIGWREGGILAAALLALLGFLALFDLRGAPEQYSHLGQAILRVRREGAEALVQIVHGKLLMNLRIFTYTSWSWILLLVLVGIPVVLRYPPAGWRPFLPAGHPLLLGARGMAATALVGLAVNDSGVVVAAMILIYLGLALVYIPEALRKGGIERACK